MEAELVDQLPEGDGWQYEPKWDGFRGIVENLGGEFHIWSRNARPLLRYFPELAELGERLPPKSAVDGEIVVVRDGAPRLRRAPDAPPSRREPGQEALGGDPGRLRLLRRAPLGRRGLPRQAVRGAAREAGDAPLRRLALDPRHELGPRNGSNGSRSPGFDGVIAKRLGLAYLPGSREASSKVKGDKTADCRRHGRDLEREGHRIASLMLGLYDEGGKLRPVGIGPGGGKQPREILARVRAAPGPEPGAAAAGRAEPLAAEGHSRVEPGQPKLVVEVRYDKWQKGSASAMARGSSAFAPTRIPTSAPSPRSARGRRRATLRSRGF